MTMTSILASSGLDINSVMGIISGAIVIVVTALTLCLMGYIKLLIGVFQLSLHDLLFGPPPLGIRLAIPMIVLKIGAILSLSMVWGWHVFGDGSQMPDMMIILLLCGIAFLIEGSLWLIRTLTYVRQGEWPWVTTAFATLAYVVGNVLWLMR
jgi:hypothetical protein